MTIRVAIQYQVIAEDQSIKDAHYRLTNPRTQIESYVYDVIRSTVPKIELDDGEHLALAAVEGRALGATPPPPCHAALSRAALASALLARSPCPPSLSPSGFL